jgi:hypothetical protein
VWLFKHPEVELAVPEVLVPDLDGTGSEMHILFSLVHGLWHCSLFLPLTFFMMDLNGLSDLAPISSPSGEPAEK